MTKEERIETINMLSEYYMRGRRESLKDAAETVSLVGQLSYTRTEIITLLRRLAEETGKLTQR